MPKDRSEKVRVTIDGRSIDAEKGKSILEVARECGIEIPSLCYHPGLESFGACRLCVVEITKPGWEGWKKLVTSCLYPVEEELIIDTRSEEVRENRSVVLDLLLARVPESDVIRQLAAEYGIHDTSYTKREDADTCIMCTICVRVCDAIGANAIATLSRGPDKYVDVPDKDACIGCLACALSCPTNAIPFEEFVNGKRKIWGREFDLVYDEISHEPIGTPEQIDHFAEKSGLPKEYFLKSDKVRKKETAVTFARVQF
ncbi:MAG: 2Fe-2S iron-sulfur cluster-binding protein [Candidatus Electryonea clarkiae]|nr:2Fe-2S iron-sulfur cluster-binding protein [Candidatus Electryonea clarkiae]MDP8286862.1 2Fe-2S iron-sulfur cluster-binding protein [Candidatus Electryonea clarkiae]